MLRPAGLRRHDLHDGRSPAYAYEAVLLDVTPFTHIAHLQQAAGAVFVVTPVEG